MRMEAIRLSVIVTTDWLAGSSQFRRESKYVSNDCFFFFHSRWLQFRIIKKRKTIALLISTFSREQINFFLWYVFKQWLINIIGFPYHVHAQKNILVLKKAIAQFSIVFFLVCFYKEYLFKDISDIHFLQTK